jgi:DNA-binding NtrC family response regulator
VADEKMSKRHFRIFAAQGAFTLEDLGSTNGTFVDGARVASRVALGERAVIRAGRCVFVFALAETGALEPAPGNRHGFAGRFHVGPLLRSLADAARSQRHLLVAGPSGSGKELAAKAIAAMASSGGGAPRLLAHNAARFASEEEAATTLFGVVGGVFSGVQARPGLIEEARGGVLFLDETHNLPLRVQRGLLRVIEDGGAAAIGEVRTRPAEVRFLFASNAPGPDFGLAPDLLNRLRVVAIPSLAERAADVPSIFEHVAGQRLAGQGVDPGPVLAALGADHYEAMCIDGFARDNARGIVDVADRLATLLGAGEPPEQALAAVFGERFGHGPVARRNGARSETGSNYEIHRELIVAAYRESGGNVSATLRALESRGLAFSRRWLAEYLEKWGIR